MITLSGKVPAGSPPDACVSSPCLARPPTIFFANALSHAVSFLHTNSPACFTDLNVLSSGLIPDEPAPGPQP